MKSFSYFLGVLCMGRVVLSDTEFDLPVARIYQIEANSSRLRPWNRIDTNLETTIENVENLRLDCTASYPVQWFYTGDGIPAYTVANKYSRNNNRGETTSEYMSTIVIKPLKEYHTGRYQCTPAEYIDTRTFFYIYVPDKSEEGALQRVKVKTPDAISYDPKAGFTVDINKVETPEGTYVCTARHGSYVRSVEYRVLSSFANYQADEPSNFQNKCKKPCGENAYCDLVDGAEVCQCLPDFQGEPNVKCSIKCEAHTDCPKTMSCFVDRQCRSPCVHSAHGCGINAKCKVEDHRPVCYCPKEWVGDETIQCFNSVQGKYNYRFSVYAVFRFLRVVLPKGRWTIAVVTAIPVLLPTIIFTNVYLQDETQGYCKLPKPHHRKPAAERVSECDDKESTLATSTTATTAQTSSRETTMEQFHSKLDFHCGTCHMLCVSCSGCWGGMLRSVCYKDQASRDNESRTVKRSIKRLLKYIFGTFVLRYISLAWYAKAFIFGVRAYRQPKKYMKMALPNTHWGYDLLVKLDFLQAALENAPQCIVQLYVLLVYSDENQILGIITLLFSFVDFVRVSVSVQWDIRKGPVIAPSGCYKTICIGRSAALALVIATAKSWSIAIPVIFMIFHSILFTKLFSKERYGLAAQKIFVSVFISIFFLPEFDTLELPVLTQLYYAVIHIENLFFIVPWYD
ncbi:Pro-epidermal growth factor [Folsomia candida]|uniref:Pro-epidermal growth factor n=1 Tax=Folsomia candida TaxID=158441 RepID=A0A226D6Z0_FOLCA|nr:Pro-epidermal growth factor [Folsomia candida]